MEEKNDKQPWHYKVVSGKEHPDNKPPVTIVSEASDEDAEKEEAAVNAAREKNHPAAVIKVVAEKKAAAVEENLDDKTVPELKEIAAAKGVHVNWDDTKADIIKAIKKAK
jgi:hypothetical protein